MTTIAARRLLTCDDARMTAENPLGVVENAIVTIEGGVVTSITAGTAAQGTAPADVAPVFAGDLGAADMRATLLTPGLIDSHTHACWAGSRHDEYIARLRGDDYRAIAARGGGIVRTHEAIRGASEEELAGELRARLARMLALGVTHVEAKSGYGLTPDLERKQLRAIDRVRREAEAGAALPRVTATYLALHAIPRDVTDRGAWIEGQIALVDEIATEKLASFVDAYVDAHAFSVDETRNLLGAATRRGLGVRLHVGQFADVGGAELAAEFSAASIDHAEHVPGAALARLKNAGTHVTLLPTANFVLGGDTPNVAVYREAGLSFCVASDANPGTAPTESLPLAMALAARLYGLTPEECWLGVTRNAARSLHAEGEGVVRVGARADLVAWNLPHEDALLQPWGTSKVSFLVRGGTRVVG